MKTTSSVKIHTTALFTIAVLLLVSIFLNIGGVVGPLPGMPKAWYWGGVILPLVCGLVAFSGGTLAYRRKVVTPLSKCALWVSLAVLYFIVLVLGSVLQQAANQSMLLSGLTLYLSRFVLPILAAWLLGVTPALVLAVLPTAMQLSKLGYGADYTGYIVLVAAGCLLSVLICTVEPFQLIGGGKLCPALMVVCAFSDAAIMQMIFNVAAIRTADHAVSIGIVEFLPFIILSALLHILAIRKKEKAEQR